MNRRELLQALLVLPGASLISSCQPSPKNDQKGYSESEGKGERLATLKVILQGPFAVVMQRDERRILKKLTAFVPLDPAHEFRFQMPRYVEKSAPQYQFILPSDGLEISGAPPYIDHGFDDLNLRLGPWQPKPKEYFVTIELPPPDLITYIPPSEPVVFEDGKIGFAPLNHVLEYKINNVSKVRLHSEQFKEDPRPLPFTRIFKGYEEHWGQERDFSSGQPHGPQREHTPENLSHPSEPEVHTFFLGVGVPPGKMTPLQAVQHALEFFNKKLMPQFPHSPDMCCKHLKEIRDYGQPCTPFPYTGPAKARPAVLTEQVQPRLRLVTSAEDCRAPGLLGTTP